MERLPTADAATPTRSPVAFVPCCENVFPISYPESATVVPRPTLICLEFMIIESGTSFGI